MGADHEKRVMRRMLAAANWDKLTSRIGATLKKQGKDIHIVTYGDPDMKEAARMRKAAN